MNHDRLLANTNGQKDATVDVNSSKCPSAALKFICILTSANLKASLSFYRSMHALIGSKATSEMCFGNVCTFSVDVIPSAVANLPELVYIIWTTRSRVESTFMGQLEIQIKHTEHFQEVIL